MIARVRLTVLRDKSMITPNRLLAHTMAIWTLMLARRQWCSMMLWQSSRKAWSWSGINLACWSLKQMTLVNSQETSTKVPTSSRNYTWKTSSRGKSTTRSMTNSSKTPKRTKIWNLMWLQSIKSTTWLKIKRISRWLVFCCSFLTCAWLALL